MAVQGRPAPVTPMFALLWRASCFRRAPAPPVPSPVRLRLPCLPTAAPLSQPQQSAHHTDTKERESMRGNKSRICGTVAARVGGHEGWLVCVWVRVPEERGGWPLTRRTWLRACSFATPVQIHCRHLLHRRSRSLSFGSGVQRVLFLATTAQCSVGAWPLPPSLPLPPR